MNKKVVYRMVLLAVIMATIVTTSVLAQGWEHTKHRTPEMGNGIAQRNAMVPGERGPRGQILAERLGLNEQQKSEYKKLHTAHLKAILPVQNQLDEAQARLKTLLTEENVNSSEVDKQVEKIGDLHTQRLKEQVHFELNVTKMLNDDQKLKYQMQKQHKGMGRRF